MIRFLVARVLWVVPMLFGVTALTFAVLEVGPVDAAEARVTAAETSGQFEARDAERRARAVEHLRQRMGLVDADGVAVPLWQRYWRWCRHAARLDFALQGEDADAFRRRFGRALAVTALLGLLALSFGVVAGTVLGCAAGFRAGGLLDRTVGGAALVLHALPEFVVASGLVLVFSGVGIGLLGDLLPTTGLRSPESGSWSAVSRVLDLAAHLTLPVLALSAAPLAIVQRHVRDTVIRVRRSSFVRAFEDLGVAPRTIDAAVVRQGVAPVAPLVGILLPAMAGGSVVIEQVFSIPGLGRLTFDAVLENDVGIVMASTLFVACVTLLASIVADVLHRVLDPRVALR